MIRFIIPFILCSAAIVLFVVFTNPTFSKVKELKAEQASYDEALVTSNKLISKRKELTEVYNSFSTEDRERLLKIMPDNIDNIRLIIDIQKIAEQYGMKPKDIKFDPMNKNTNTAQSSLSPEQINQNKKEYGVFDLEFSLEGTYENFIKFVKDVEQSLRIVDITGVNFSVQDGKNIIKFTLKTKTYWLKN